MLQAADSDDASSAVAAQQAFDKGDFSRAAADWEKAAARYRHTGNTNAEVRAAISLAGAQQSIGQQRMAAQVLEDALPRAITTGDKSLVALVKWKLGAALVITREPTRADSLLGEALDYAKASNDQALTAAILNDLGNSFAREQNYSDALKAYDECISLARQSANTNLLASALCNAAATAAQSGDFARADGLNQQALAETDQLAPSRDKAFLLLTIGQTDRQFTNSTAATLRAHDAFQQALQISESRGDNSTETYALGFLAQLYEQDGQIETALTLARRAAFAAQQAQMSEALYRWEWLIGRCLAKQGNREAAIAAYRRALQSLQPVRSDLSAGYGNGLVRLTFRESVGPLYYELADLLLTQAKAATDPKQQQLLLREARDTVEGLKAVELEDYLCDECVDVLKSKTRAVETIDPHSAVIYLIPLPDRTEMLLGLASGLKLYTVPVRSSELTAVVRDFRHNLETRTTYGYLEQAQQLYNWFIRPMRGYLEENKITTLVFVPDGALRTIPFAALHDGQRFLIEDLAVAVVPGLSLVEPKTLERHKPQLLMNGVSQSVQGFAPLDFVTNELNSINGTYSGQTLLNEQFTLAQLQEKLRDQQFSIVHIASHGQFDRDVRKTFVLTYDQKLTLDGLEASIRPSAYRGKPIELLVLSACQTAAGDDRAALGLAGVAVKAGARSALASLWFVNDQSTSALITEFYRQLSQHPDISKAQALQAAQIHLLADRRYEHPCYWSPYLIIGNWL